MVFETMALRKMCEPKLEEGMERWRRECRGDLIICRPHSRPNIVRVIKSKIMSWAGHVARMETAECMPGLGGETWGKQATWKNYSWMGG
jgi:hypothetical protein